MKKHHATDTSSFILEGQFLGFIWDGSKIKYLRIAAAEGELTIKLSKEARASCKTVLKTNDPIQVLGQTKIDRKTEEIEFKAERIITEKDPVLEAFKQTEKAICEETLSPCHPCSSTNKKVKLLICQKSGCQKKGGKGQHQAIEAILRDRGLHQSVILQESGCLGKCSLAPNIVLMPSKKRLSGMKPEAIVDLISFSHVID
jgi:(2Fe-2S) ferredoxin